MSDGIALVTNVTQYAGPPSVAALSRAGLSVVAHDRTFTDATARDIYCTEHPEVAVIAEQEPGAIVEAATQEYGQVDVLVSNDVWSSGPCPIEDASVDEYRQALEALLVMPFALTKAVVGQMKSRRTGRVILITSAGPACPFPELAMYHSARGGANSLVTALSAELGPFNIPVNAVAPNFLESELFYPKEHWETDPTCSQYLHDHVPMQRLGEPKELGELVTFLASGECEFVTGQIIRFSGGWPGMPPWPGTQQTATNTEATADGTS
jgi:3-oxoacyl-[acyl-carrier protein] reductase